MKLPIKLQDLLQQNESAITAASTFLSQKLTVLDCTDVETVTAEKLALLFSGIPENWDFNELEEIIDFSTIHPIFSQQLQQWINQRLGVAPQTRFLEQTGLVNQPQFLDIFNFRNEVINDYRRYIESFLKISDPKVKAFVDQELDKGQLWTDPLVQLNPTYKKGATVTELVKQGVLHRECDRYFSKDGKPMTFHYHQKQAFEIAQRQEPYIVTTGTGSGKSLTYVVPIINDLLHHPEIQGVRAILVYPMNALINSQEEALKEFLRHVPETHIRVAKYTGQEGLTRKTEIQNNPPHILLTNYVMLELMLSRTHENQLVESPNLKFLVLDELHTYRGRQGADIAILIRKLRQRNTANSPHSPLLCIGTSATMSTEGSREQRRQVVADVASKLFGVNIQPSHVIDETLERSIQRSEPTVEELRTSIIQGLPPESEQTLENFQQHPLSHWIEMNFGLKEEVVIERVTDNSTSTGKYNTSPQKSFVYVRRQPITLEEGAEKLVRSSASAPVQDALKRYYEQCLNVLKEMFLWGSKTKRQSCQIPQTASQRTNNSR